MFAQAKCESLHNNAYTNLERLSPMRGAAVPLMGCKRQANICGDSVSSTFRRCDAPADWKDE